MTVDESIFLVDASKCWMNSHFLLYYLLGFKHKLGPTEFCQVKRIGEKLKEIFFSIGIQKSIFKRKGTNPNIIMFFSL